MHCTNGPLDAVRSPQIRFRLRRPRRCSPDARRQRPPSIVVDQSIRRGLVPVTLRTGAALTQLGRQGWERRPAGGHSAAPSASRGAWESHRPSGCGLPLTGSYRKSGLNKRAAAAWSRSPSHQAAAPPAAPALRREGNRPRRRSSPQTGSERPLGAGRTAPGHRSGTGSSHPHHVRPAAWGRSNAWRRSAGVLERSSSSLRAAPTARRECCSRVRSSQGLPDSPSEKWGFFTLSQSAVF